LRQILRAWGIEHEYNRSENFITSGGNTYYFFGANNEASQDVVQGMTAAGALADEAALLPQSFVEQMIARCSVDGAKIWFNCNPKGQLHWFKQDYIDKRKDKRIYYLQFRLDDNLTLSKRKKEMYKRQFTGVFYSRNILGEWVAASGRIYDMISSGDTVPATGRKYSKYYVSIDYGTQNPMAYGLWGLNGGTWYKCDEYHYDGRKTQRQKTDAEYYDDLVAFANGRPITAVIVDPSAASFITAIRKGGLFTVKKAKNDVVDGIRCTSTAIQNGRIKFTDACPETMKEFETYVWDDAAREKGKEQPLKVNDHHMDETRYFVYTILRREGMNSWT
jgi:PBSX family phage terminase large subunit